MPRISRKYLKTKFFHVITQGNNKNYIFDQPEDIKKYIKIMYEIKEEYNIEIISYCIMHNHTHMLVKINEISELSSYMHKLNMKYAVYYNKKYDRVGYVFRDRFKSEEIYNQKHFISCVNYIYNNPVKAKICKNPEEYPYSNYSKNKVYDDITDDYIFIDIDEDKKIICKDIINAFLQKNNLNIYELKKDKTKLKNLVNMLNVQYKISFRTMEQEMEIGRETLRKLCK